MIAIAGRTKLVYLGSKSQMLVMLFAAARHTNLAQELRNLASMLAKNACCPSCSLIQRRVLLKKFVLTWFLKLVRAIRDAAFNICTAQCMMLSITVILITLKFVCIFDL